MKNYFLNLLNIFKNKNNSNIFSIQELNQFRQNERKIKLARKSREYIADLNKKQRLWLEKINKRSRKVS
tara:strand:- start:600 stop:806 length:207 start_codon:yes stop_codon:yes gene_type:complete